MKIATFNVNSIRSRVDLITTWLSEKNPIDILCMQELKCIETQFPKEKFEQLGYVTAILTVKSVIMALQFARSSSLRG